MSSWKPAFALLLVFIAGLVVGVVGTRMVVRQVATEMLQHPEAAQTLVQKRMELGLARRLQLGPLQRERVREILAEMQGQLKLINQETQPRRAAVITNAEEPRLMLVLNPDQKLAFERLKEGISRPACNPTPLASTPTNAAAIPADARPNVRALKANVSRISARSVVIATARPPVPARFAKLSRRRPAG